MKSALDALFGCFVPRNKQNARRSSKKEGSKVVELVCTAMTAASMELSNGGVSECKIYSPTDEQLVEMRHRANFESDARLSITLADLKQRLNAAPCTDSLPSSVQENVPLDLTTQLTASTARPQEEPAAPLLSCTCIPSLPFPVLDRLEDYVEENGIPYLRVINALVNRYTMTQIVTDGAGTVMEVLNETVVDLPVSSVVELVELQEEAPDSASITFEEIL